MTNKRERKQRDKAERARGGERPLIRQSVGRTACSESRYGPPSRPARRPSPSIMMPCRHVFDFILRGAARPRGTAAPALDVPARRRAPASQMSPLTPPFPPSPPSAWKKLRPCCPPMYFWVSQRPRRSIRNCLPGPNTRADSAAISASRVISTVHDENSPKRAL